MSIQLLANCAELVANRLFLLSESRRNLLDGWSAKVLKENDFLLCGQVLGNDTQDRGGSKSGFDDQAGDDVRSSVSV